MNLRTERINTHAKWHSQKLNSLGRSKIGSDHPENNRRDYYEKIAGFYMSVAGEFELARRTLLAGGIDKKTLDGLEKAAFESLPPWKAPSLWARAKMKWRETIENLKERFEWE